MGAFRVDPDRLDGIIDQITRFDSQMEAALDEVDARINRLHATWTGEAADQHRRAHDEWQRGAAEMRAALAAMRANAATARANYTNAITANVRMWEQLR